MRRLLNRAATPAIALALALALTACGARSDLADAHPSAGAGAASSTSTTSTTSTASAPPACLDEIVATDPSGAAALAVDGTTVFWGTIDGRIFARASGVTAELAHAISPVVFIAVDAEHLYYPDGFDILAVPRAGGAPESVVSQIGEATQLAVDDGALYFFLHGNGVAQGRLMRADIAGGAVTELLAGLNSPNGLAVDTTDIFVACDGLAGNEPFSGTLLRLPKTGGGAPTMLASALSFGVQNVVLDGDRAYFLEHVTGPPYASLIRAVPKAGGAVATVLSLPDVTALGFVVGANDAHLTTHEPGVPSIARLMRGAFDGGGVEEIAAAEGVVYLRPRASADAVYWTIDWVPAAPPAETISVRKTCR